MKNYRIVHTETLIGHYYVEAESVEDALDVFYHEVCNGEIDFSNMEMVDSEDIAEEC